MEPKYKRIVLKITGEALKDKAHIFSRLRLERLAEEIESLQKLTDLILVIGGGNIVRGRDLAPWGFKAADADYIGMTATISNALFVGAYLQTRKLDVRVMSALEIKSVAEPYIYKKAKRHLEKGRVIILAGGTGNIGVTTDEAAVVRALELEADVVLKGTKVDGVYTADPKLDKNAVLIKELSYGKFLSGDFAAILDKSAVARAEKYRIPIFVFNIFHRGNLKKAVRGRAKGTLIS